jgi:hypothetical protein
VRDLLGSYLGNDLRPRERQFVTLHLAICPRCAQELRACESLLTRLPTDTETFAPAETRARILGRVQVRRRELAASRQPFWQSRTTRGLVFATTLGAAAVAAVLLTTPPVSRPSSDGDKPGVVGESPSSREPVVAPQPHPPPPVAPLEAPQVQNSGPVSTSPPSMDLRPRSSNRRYDRRREAARKRAKKVQEERETAAREAQQPEQEVVAPAPNGPDDATVAPTP